MHRILSSSEWIPRIAVPMVPSNLTTRHRIFHAAAGQVNWRITSILFFNKSKELHEQMGTRTLFSGERKPHALLQSHQMWDFRFPSCLELADSMPYQFSVNFQVWSLQDYKHCTAEKLGNIVNPVDIQGHFRVFLFYPEKERNDFWCKHQNSMMVLNTIVKEAMIWLQVFLRDWNVMMVSSPFNLSTIIGIKAETRLKIHALEHTWISSFKDS